jgi:hypothetical protein
MKSITYKRIKTLNTPSYILEASSPSRKIPEGD